MVTSQLNYRSPASKSLVEQVYKPYLRVLQKTERELEKTKSVRPIQKLVRGKGVRKWVRNLLGKALMIASVLTGNAIDMSKLR
jgi:muramidase (phage lysozyme)